MNTSHVVSALRNAASPRARLAAWQSRPLFRRIKTLESSAPCERLSLRASIIQSTGPELSAPEAEKPLLWLSGDSDPEILESWAGRDFLDHRGWFTDEFQEGTLETYAVRLKRFPRLIFYAVRSSDSGDLKVYLDEWEEIDFSDCQSDYDSSDAVKDCAKEVIRGNESTTQRQAEEEVEYQRKWQIEADIEENKETLKTLRHSIRSLAHELKTLCPSPMAADFPAAASALRASLKSLLRDRSRIMEKNQELAASL